MGYDIYYTCKTQIDIIQQHVTGHAQDVTITNGSQNIPRIQNADIVIKDFGTKHFFTFFIYIKT